MSHLEWVGKQHAGVVDIHIITPEDSRTERQVHLTRCRSTWTVLMIIYYSHSHSRRIYHTTALDSRGTLCVRSSIWHCNVPSYLPHSDGF